MPATLTQSGGQSTHIPQLSYGSHYPLGLGVHSPSTNILGYPNISGPGSLFSLPQIPLSGDATTSLDTLTSNASAAAYPLPTSLSRDHGDDGTDGELSRSNDQTPTNELIPSPIFSAWNEYPRGLSDDYPSALNQVDAQPLSSLPQDASGQEPAFGWDDFLANSSPFEHEGADEIDAFFAEFHGDRRQSQVDSAHDTQGGAPSLSLTSIASLPPPPSHAPPSVWHDPGQGPGSGGPPLGSGQGYLGGSSLPWSNYPASGIDPLELANQILPIPQNAHGDFNLRTASPSQTSDQLQASFPELLSNRQLLQSPYHDLVAISPSTWPSTPYGLSNIHPAYMNQVPNAPIPSSSHNSFGMGASSTSFYSAPSHQYEVLHTNNYPYHISDLSVSPSPSAFSANFLPGNSPLVQGSSHLGSLYNPGIQSGHQPVDLYFQHPYTTRGAPTVSSSTLPGNGQQTQHYFQPTIMQGTSFASQPPASHLAPAHRQAVDLARLSRALQPGEENINAHRRALSQTTPIKSITSSQDWARLYNENLDEDRSAQYRRKIDYQFSGISGTHFFAINHRSPKVNLEAINPLYTDSASVDPNFASAELGKHRENDKVIYSRDTALKPDDIHSYLSIGKSEAEIEQIRQGSEQFWRGKPNYAGTWREAGKKSGLVTGADALAKGLRQEGVYLDTARPIIDPEIARNTLKLMRGKTNLDSRLSDEKRRASEIEEGEQRLGLLRALRAATLRQTSERWRDPSAVHNVVPLLYMVKHREHLPDNIKDTATLRSIYSARNEDSDEPDTRKYLGGYDLAAQDQGAKKIRASYVQDRMALWSSDAMQAIYKNYVQTPQYRSNKVAKHGANHPEFKDYMDWIEYKINKVNTRYTNVDENG